MNVKKLNGYRPPSCGCVSYQEHWEKATGKSFGRCSALNCSKDARDGGHVINCHGNVKNIWYIVPICDSCNSISTDKCYPLKKNALPVPVTNTKMC